MTQYHDRLSQPIAKQKNWKHTRPQQTPHD
jgi:hypothetical protein